jgi:murein L,D-transpeptidase YcbB/YkuD
MPRTSASRRAVLLGAGATFLGTQSSWAQSSSASWLDNLTGFSNSGVRPAEAPRAAEPEQLADLRTSTVPWRSEAMLESMADSIARHEQLATQGGWTAIPTGRVVRPGEGDERMPAVRRRLYASADLPDSARNSFWSTDLSLDGEIEAGLKRFQERHGLRVNGRLDKPTVESMNVPIQTRIEQLKLNRRRISELLTGRGEDRYILVNAAAYQLEAVEQREVKQRHRVIVGKPDRQTPSVRATVRALNFFPFWRVPESVATLDLIPRLRKEPEYLQNEVIRVFNGFNGPELDPRNVNWNTADGRILKFRQDPGPRNALGLVRIDMPNEHIVYMHDTPLKPLFSQRQRAFSAGCVRVQDVFKLVEWIARFENGWDNPGRVAQVIDAGQPVDVTLTRPIPVIFTYITAWAEQDGRTHFVPDIYGRDGLRDLTSGEKDPDAPPPPSGGLAP